MGVEAGAAGHGGLPCPRKRKGEVIIPAPWSKGRLVGQKRLLRPKDDWAIRVRLEVEETHSGAIFYGRTEFLRAD